VSGGLIALHVALLVIGSLITLNFYLRGALKAQVTAVLALLLIGTIGAIWVLYGWKAGVLALPLAYLYVGVTTPIAKFTAHRLLGYRTSAESGTEFSDLHALEAGKLSLDKYFERAQRQMGSEEAHLRRLMARPTVQKVLSDTGNTEADVRELVRLLSLTAAGTELTLSAIANPESLRELLALRREGWSALELGARVMEL
jgi:hypothetical protein